MQRGPVRLMLDPRHRFDRRFTGGLWLLILVLAAAAPRVAAQSTWYVDASLAMTGDGMSPGTAFLTIEEGIAAASGGDTVVVAPGSYTPVATLTINAPLNLEGAQLGATARGRVIGAPNPAVESIVSGAGVLVTLASGAAGTVIDGFAFSGGTRAIDASAGAATPLQGLTIRNNYFGSGTDHIVFLQGLATDLTVTRNAFEAIGTSTALRLDDGDFDGLRVFDNDILRPGNPMSGIGLYADGAGNVGPSVARVPTIEGNRFEGHATGADLGTQAFTGGDIIENEFTSNGVGLGFGIQNALIARNVFSNQADRGLALGDGSTLAGEGALNLTIRNNDFSGSGVADISLSGSQVAGTIQTNVIRENRLTSAVALRNDDATAGLINAALNWWNDASGPSLASHPSGFGSQVAGVGSAAVDFSPWLGSGVDSDILTAGFQSDFLALTIDDDSPQIGGVNRLAEGYASLATGGVLSVEVGNYDQSVLLVDRSATFQGPTTGSALIRASQDTMNSPSDARGWFLVTAADVVFRDLDFDGQSGLGRIVHQALRIKTATATVEDCSFQNVFSSAYQ
ncbi:MAG: right-handed parallel beta-helix repeat-containing protein, partial [Planctomycetes bacterium]|nr:right-handed parallel beta-helix repeat-containing protein [Planctomycetota bacterium]